MRIYEVVFIAAPNLTTEELDDFIAQMQTVIEGKKGKVLKVDNWGKKSMAYRIQKFREGYYVVLTLEGNGAMIAELERRFRVADHVFRFISVRIDEDQKRAEKLKAMRQKKSLARKSRAPETDAGTEAAPA